MKVKDVIAVKGSNVVTIQESHSILNALEKFSAYRVGSLLVKNEADEIVGILSPRDVLMEVLNRCDQIGEVKVLEVMTRDLIISTPDDDLNYVQAIMTENRIRHLPIMDGQNLAGIISIGDVVKAQLKEINAENKYLRDYMVSKYPA